MATTHSTSNGSAASTQQYATDFVTAQDGVLIGYRQLGYGPGVVLLHGAMESAQSHMQLAVALADSFTVYVPDRRGRGLSGPYSKEYSLQNDVADMAALLTKTGARNVFGVSSGADIWLQAALSLPAIQKAALYEPALFADTSTPRAFLTRFDREMSQGKFAAAMVTAMKGAQMGPPIFNALPRWLLESLTGSAIKGEDKKAKPGEITMRMLGSTLHYDFEVVTEMSGRFQDFNAVRADVLLLGGSKSPAYLKNALATLEKVLPNVAGRIEFPGLDHGGSSDVSNTNRGGNPELVARELRRFFAEP
jgi:pimeloyl-ACP methyl ester carboxylesterase